MIGKKVVYICIIIIGMIIALPFNYIYGMGGFEVDVIWAIFGIVMIASGVHLLKKSVWLIDQSLRIHFNLEQ